MKNYVATAYFSSKRIPLKEIVKNVPLGNLIKRESSFLLYEIANSEYIYLKDYGGIGLFNTSENLRKYVFDLLKAYIDIEPDSHIESISAVVSDEFIPSEFDQIIVQEINPEVVHIICLNLTQSAALFYFKSLTDQLLENTKIHTIELEMTGKVSLRGKKLLKYIGSILNIKNKISENLYVFDTPLFAYENESINKIDNQLSEELEIKYRYNAIKEELNIIKENLDLFKDISLHNHSSTLEWIIILLILFEILQVLFEKLFT